MLPRVWSAFKIYRTGNTHIINRSNEICWRVVLLQKLWLVVRASAVIALLLFFSCFGVCFWLLTVAERRYFGCRCVRHECRETSERPHMFHRGGAAHSHSPGESSHDGLEIRNSRMSMPFAHSNTHKNSLFDTHILYTCI